MITFLLFLLETHRNFFFNLSQNFLRFLEVKPIMCGGSLILGPQKFLILSVILSPQHAQPPAMCQYSFKYLYQLLTPVASAPDKLILSVILCICLPLHFSE